MATKALDRTDRLPVRFAPPARPRGLIRSGLLRDLNAASIGRQLLLVRGPAGAGKTTLLSQWADQLQHSGRPCSWLSLDESDQELSCFLDGLAEALRAGGAEESAAEAAAAAAGVERVPLSLTAQRIASAINSSSAGHLLILDAFERGGQQAATLVSLLLRHAPALRVAIASRGRLMASTGAQRAANQLFEIGPSELNFSPAETCVVLEATGLPELYTRMLHERTSGSPIAISLVRTALEQSAGAARGTASWQEWLADFYRSEVLEPLLPTIRSQMARLVVVERFDLSLAQALVGPGATELVEALHQEHSLLLKDRYRADFRFPETLRQFLRERLVWLDEGERAGLHRRAALWFAERDLLREAVRHAGKAGDTVFALDLLGRLGGSAMVAKEGAATARLLLDPFDPLVHDLDAADPQAQLGLTMVDLHQGRIGSARQRLAEVRSRIDAEAEPAHHPLRPQLLLMEGFLAGFLDRGLEEDHRIALADMVRRTPESDHPVRAQANVLLSWDSYRRGDLAAAESYAAAAAEDHGATDSIYGALFAHVHRAFALYWSNRLAEALRESEIAFQLAQIFFSDDQRLVLVTDVIRGELHRESGRPDLAGSALDLVGSVGALESWCELQLWAHRHAARSAAASGHLDEARAILAHGIEVGERLGTPRLGWNMRLLTVELEVRWGELGRVRVEEDTALFGEQTGEFGFTWFEAIGRDLVCARLRTAQGRFDEAEFSLAAAARKLARTSIPRFSSALLLGRAQLAASRGDGKSARQFVAEAAAACPTPLPSSLFAEAGVELEPFLLDLDLRSQDSAPVAPVPPPSQDGWPQDPLTGREREILRFMGEGHPNKVAAHRLGLSEATVKFHLRNIYRKLDAQNRTQALARYRSLFLPAGSDF